MTNSDKREVKRQDIYEEFVLWSAMPPTERLKLGIETQEQFVEFYKIGINTPTAWKRRRDFETRVTALRKEWAFDKTNEVIYGIYRSAVKGNPHSQKLWLQYFLNFSEKQEIKQTNVVEVGVNDVRFIIDGLPEPARTKFRAQLRELIDYANAVKNARDADPAVWNERTPQPVLDAADDNMSEPATKETSTAVATRLNYSPSSCDPYATFQTRTVDWTAAASCVGTPYPAARSVV